MDTNRQLQDLSTTKTLNSEAPKPSTALRQFSDSSTGIPWWEKKERLQCNVEELLENLEPISSFHLSLQFQATDFRFVHQRKTDVGLSHCVHIDDHFLFIRATSNAFKTSYTCHSQSIATNSIH